MLGHLLDGCPEGWPFFACASIISRADFCPAHYLRCRSHDNAQRWLSSANYLCTMTHPHSHGCPGADCSQGHTSRAHVQGPSPTPMPTTQDLGLRSQPPHFASTAPLSPLPPQSIETRGLVPTTIHSFLLTALSIPPFLNREAVVWMYHQTDQMLH